MAFRSGRPAETIFTNGVFDLFHEGHFNLLHKANAEGDYLLVGVASDESCANSKRRPWQTWDVRARAVGQVPFVDEVIKTPWSVDLTREFYDRHGITVQVQGDHDSSFPVAEELGILKISRSYPRDIDDEARSTSSKVWIRRCWTEAT